MSNYECGFNEVLDGLYPMFTVLSIDGGGIRGVIPAVLLQYLEDKTGRPVSNLFDLIVGTSTGGILATGLAVPKAGGKPKFSAKEMLALYTDRGGDIFERSFWRGVTSLGGTTDEQYDHRPLERILKKYLGDAALADCIKPIVVTSYDIERREPYFFKTSRAQKDKDRNHYLRDVARATSAAPTFFEPEVVRSLAKKPSRRVLIDGGVFVNNPAMCAYTEAFSLGAKPDNMAVVSLGTWGALGWVRPIISVMMDGEADAADYHLRQLLPDEDSAEKQRYFRFDTKLDLALDDMDAAGKGNIDNLKQEAEQIIVEQAEELDRMIDLLTAADT
jgi:patatin-like phospholipase/acyl hydrolase